MSKEFAFPVSEENFQKNWAEPGMTLRDYFAAKAMQAMISTMSVETVDVSDEIDEDFFEVARGAYAQADAMLKVRGE